MIQQGQVFKLTATGADGEPLWAYRYRVGGRGSARLQVGGFSTRAEAQRALQNKLARLFPGGRAMTLTLGEWVEEYLDTHQGERVTIAKLRWLLGKATAELGEVRLAELSPEQVCAWRLTVPEGHRFEATQALRQVLNRAVCVEADRRQPGQARAESRPALPGAAAVRFLGAAPVARRAARADPRADGSCSPPRPGFDPPSCSRSSSGDVDRAAGVVQIRRAYANGRVKHTKTRLSRRAVPLQAIASRRSTSFGRGKTACCSSRTRAAATSTSATSTVGTGSPFRKRLGSSRCATSTTCATPTPPSRSAPACRCSPSRASWARASR